MENTQIGPFLIAERLGSNRRQQVYRATQVEQNLDVALKFIGIPESAKRAKAIEKIRIEVELLKQLDHPNLVKILGAGVEQEQIFFASELIKGESLTAILARRGKFAADQVIDYGRQIAGLLDYLHENDIVHSKLTPDKILITKEGVIKVADLRLNRSKKRRWDSSRKRELDIAAYMAPEQFTHGATEKSDIYSLGIILYEMLTGKLPYEPDTMGRMTRRKMRDNAPSVSTLAMNCPVWLDKIVCQMISPDPRLRPHTAKAVILSMDELRVLDETKKSAVSQVSGSFNPLTAGTDKTEANRLLGKTKSTGHDLSIFQSTGFMVVGLVLIACVLVFAMLPASSEQNFETAKKLMLSDDSSDLREARSYLKKIIANGPSDKLFADAESTFYESRRRTLLMQAERGRVLGIQSPASQKFIEADRAVKDGELKQARKLLRELHESVDPNGDERHIHSEVKTRLEGFSDLIVLPTSTTELSRLVEEHRNLVNKDDVDFAIIVLNKVSKELSGQEKFDDVVNAANQLIENYTVSEVPVPTDTPENDLNAQKN